MSKFTGQKAAIWLTIVQALFYNFFLITIHYSSPKSVKIKFTVIFQVPEANHSSMLLQNAKDATAKCDLRWSG